MANKNTFKTIIEGTMKRGNLPSDVLGSKDWYRKKAKDVQSLRRAKPQKILKIGRQNKRMKPTIKGRIMLGKMFMFEYDPKMKESLPYYDKFPLIFPIEADMNGFLGINLHYLPHTWRAILMDNLYDLLNNEDMDESTRLRLFNNGYTTLKKSAKYRYFRPCIKKYLFEQVSSRFMEVPPDEWEIALFLPLERFHGTTRRKVWNDTRRNFKKGMK
jgi:hypothetical protein